VLANWHNKYWTIRDHVESARRSYTANDQNAGKNINMARER